MEFGIWNYEVRKFNCHCEGGTTEAPPKADKNLITMCKEFVHGIALLLIILWIILLLAMTVKLLIL